MYARPNNTLLLCGYEAKKFYTVVYTEGFHTAFKSTDEVYYGYDVGYFGVRENFALIRLSI